eukprot:gnl/TRDRNA2_/TRDRNA2_149574_c2_seq1.p1 gnl/TRDRNA2_/TRDRNA2_149574_c2~~gnl/TRDRNA2_/TRDRNA2_149574_c2_seq1.p1  ORF type:complete len:351 (+),score=59.50 gnl/TRDRNA2_/TRDRNA2_149574_c2_seq1:92-1054(+)
MAEEESFALKVVMLCANIPSINMIRVSLLDSVELVQADLEEIEMPREPRHVQIARAEREAIEAQKVKEALELNPPDLGPPASEEMKSVGVNMRFIRPKMLQFHCKPIGPANAKVIAEGMKEATFSEPLGPLGGGPHIEEIGWWGCQLRDGGAVSLAGALSEGCGALLHTLLLDENEIGAPGGTALGAGLRGSTCPLLREIGLSNNPLTVTGFRAVVVGLASCPKLVLLDCSATALDDVAAEVAVDALADDRWPELRTVRLSRNPDISQYGAEVLTRVLPHAPTSLKLLDIKGSGGKAGAHTPRIMKVLEDIGIDKSRLRI